MVLSPLALIASLTAHVSIIAAVASGQHARYNGNQLCRTLPRTASCCRCTPVVGGLYDVLLNGAPPAPDYPSKDSAVASYASSQDTSMNPRNMYGHVVIATTAYNGRVNTGMHSIYNSNAFPKFDMNLATLHGGGQWTFNTQHNQFLVPTTPKMAGSGRNGCSCMTSSTTKAPSHNCDRCTSEFASTMPSLAEAPTTPNNHNTPASVAPSFENHTTRRPLEPAKYKLRW